MICFLNFCHKDWEQAKKLLNWIGVLGGCPNQDLILQSSITAAANGMAAELEVEAQGKFRSVAIRVTDVDDERGWPYSCNNGWREAVNHIRDRTMRPWLYTQIEEKPGSPRWKEQVDAAAKRFAVPWLFGEPDMVPTRSGWLDEIEAAYTECSSRKKDPKYLMGGEVKIPQHRMSGVAVYPPGVAQFTRGLPYLTNTKGPWDQVLAKDFQPFVQYTPLIQNIWNLIFGQPESEPTFPDQASLSLIDPKAVLFHRNSDGTLIDRLMEREFTAIPNSPTFQIITKEVAPDLINEVRNGKTLESVLRDRIADMEKQVEAATKIIARYEAKPRKSGKRPKFKTPAKRTAEQQKAIDERMAKLRARRKVAA